MIKNTFISIFNFFKRILIWIWDYRINVRVIDRYLYDNEILYGGVYDMDGFLYRNKYLPELGIKSIYVGSPKITYIINNEYGCDEKLEYYGWAIYDIYQNQYTGTKSKIFTGFTKTKEECMKIYAQRLLMDIQDI
jgi:hypothetical protein